MTHSLDYLNPADGDWRACFDASLLFLRQSWDNRWVGLPFLVDACADFLHLGGLHQTNTTTKLLAAAREVATQIEADADLGTIGAEPRYHNRLHFSDSLTTITIQSAIESARWQAYDAEWSAAMLLIAVAHDFRHPGRVNAVRAEIEQKSFATLRPYLAQNQVPEPWLGRVEAVILQSDFSTVAENHHRVAGRDFSWCTDWATVLLNEADIMASIDPLFGPRMGQALSAEWELIQFSAYRTVATEGGRRDFLRSVQFSSYSAGVLGAAEKVRYQLENPSTLAPTRP
jgi:hypothetical protein